MKLALIFPDRISIQLAQAVVTSDRFDLTGIYGSGPDLAALAGVPLHPSAAQLPLNGLEGVIFGTGGPSEHRAECLRTLVQAEIPMIVVHPACDMLLGFEMQMAQAASSLPILPFVNEMWHPWLLQIQEWSKTPHSSPLGLISQIELRRPWVANQPTIPSYQFCRDAMLIRMIFGRIQRLNAFSPGAKPDLGSTGNALPNSLNSVYDADLLVQMADESDRLIRWSWSKSHARAGVELQLIGANASCTVRMDDDPSKWTIQSDHGSIPFPPSEFDPFRQALEMLEGAVRDVKIRDQVDRLWEHACRSVELEDAVQRSYKRGRTIDLHLEEHSEESSFKGVMAAGGCLALILALLVIPLVMLVEQIAPAMGRDGQKLVWPWMLLATMLCGFLGLQLLRLVIPRASTGRSSAWTAASPGPQRSSDTSSRHKTDPG